MVGLFINTLPIRVKVKRQIKLIPWLQQLQNEQNETLGDRSNFCRKTINLSTIKFKSKSAS